MLGGLLAFPLPVGKQVLQSLRDYLPTVPDELTTTTFLLTTPDGHKALGVGLCYCGDPAAGEEWVAPIRQMGPVVMDQLGVMPYPALQSMLDQVAMPGRRYYLKSNFVDELHDEAIDVLIDAYLRVPSPLTAVLLVQMGGAVSRADRAALPSTIGMRRCPSAPLPLGRTQPRMRQISPGPGSCGRTCGRTCPGGVYVNELADEGEERVRAAYGPAYDRLAALKKQVRSDQSFPPEPEHQAGGLAAQT